jgi:hypothetical protein
MRKVAMLIICLLSSSFAADIANGQTEPAAEPVPSNYRAQIVRQMSQAYDLGKIQDAGITPPIFTFVSLVHGRRWVVCVATFEDAVLFGTFYRMTIVTFKDGQAEILSAAHVKGTGSASRSKVNASGYCQGLTTSPLPEIVRGKPLS